MWNLKYGTNEPTSLTWKTETDTENTHGGRSPVARQVKGPALLQLWQTKVTTVVQFPSLAQELTHAAGAAKKKEKKEKRNKKKKKKRMDEWIRGHQGREGRERDGQGVWD